MLEMYMCEYIHVQVCTSLYVHVLYMYAISHSSLSLSLTVIFSVCV